MRFPASVLLCASAAAAQTFVVSPPPYARQEGPGNNEYPWTGPFRYQQVHTDLGSTPRVLTGLAWRRNQDQFLPSGMPRTLDMEAWMCGSSFASWSTTFASNYVGTPSNSFLRKPVNTPDWGARIVQRPAPFDHLILFDTPYLHTGANDLLYELVVHTSTTPSSFMADAANFPITVVSMWGTYTSVGNGCTTTSGTFLVRSELEHVLASSTISFRWSVTGAPPATAGVVLLGLAPLNVPIPGLCTNLYTDGSLLNVPFPGSNSGSATTPALPVPFDPAWASLVLSAQAAAPDATQAGIPVAASQGIRWEIPPVKPTVQGARAWNLGNPTAPTGSIDRVTFLVTQFRMP